MVTFELNKESLNKKFTLKGMSHNSIILTDDNGYEVYCHRKVLNTILKSEVHIPCALINREYMGKTITWLATMFTF